MNNINLFFHATKIPDLSLNKYCSGEKHGVKGMLDKHIAFLRQWNRKGILSGVSLHLYYVYSPDKPQGDRLDIYLLARGRAEKMKNAVKIMKASSFAADYGLVLVCDDDVDGLYDYIFSGKPSNPDIEVMKKQIERETSFKVEEKDKNSYLFEGDYNKCVILSKRELFIKPGTAVSENDENFYTFSSWEMNEDARLYQMLSMMKTIDKKVMYRVDLYPIDKASNIRDAFVDPIKMINRRQNALKSAGNLNKDLEADRVLKTYEEIAESVEDSPHFIANIYMFGNVDENSDDISVILDAAGSEALIKGNYTISVFDGKYNWETFFNDDNSGYYTGISGKEKMILGHFVKGMFVCGEQAKKYGMRYMSTLFNLEEVSPFFRLPALYEDEIIEKRKETAPNPVDKNNGVFLGKDTNGYQVYFPLKNLAKHAFISGVPGSGKTNTMHHITSTLWKEHKIPFLVLEPAKQEYRALANEKGMEDLYVFSPNADMSFPLHINPFEFPKGLMVAEHIRRLVSVFEGAFPLDNPMPFLLDTAIEAVYRDMGWSPETVYTDNTKLKFPTVSMLYKKLEEELETTKYSDEVRGNLESALKVRIGSLLRREMGDVFDVPESTIPPEKWLDIPAVIELESMGSGPANFLTLMLCALIREVLKVNPRCDKDHARHIIFIEEAHNLIGPEAEEATGGEANPKQAATAFVVKMLAEVRALKEGIVIADQLPTVMAQEVIKNTGLKIGLRITSADDRGLLGSTMAANAIQMEEMATFNVGEALISYEGLMKPFKMRMNEWCGHYPEEEKKRTVAPKNDEDLRIMLSDRKSYREICERSYVISGKKFEKRFDELYSEYSEYSDLFKNLMNAEIVLEKLEQGRKELIMSGDVPREEINKYTEQINLLRKGIDRDIKTKSYYRGVQTYIKKYIAIMCDILNSYSHWKKLGIEGLDQLKKLKKVTVSAAIGIYSMAKKYIQDDVLKEYMDKLSESFLKGEI